MFALIKPFWPLIWRGLAAVAIMLAVWWAWNHYVADPYIEVGRAEERVNTEAVRADLGQKVAQQTKRAEDAEAANMRFREDYASLQGKYQEQTMKVYELEKTTIVAKAETKKALQELAKQSSEAKSEIERLRGIAGQELIKSKEQDCEEASVLLDSIDERLRRRITADK